MAGLPKRQRVAAYAVIIRDGRILLSRLSPTITSEELWTLPGGGLDHGEDPRDAVIREIYEETGLHAVVGETARVYSAHLPGVWRDGRRVDALRHGRGVDAVDPDEVVGAHAVARDGDAHDVAVRPILVVGVQRPIRRGEQVRHPRLVHHRVAPGERRPVGRRAQHDADDRGSLGARALCA